MMVMMMAMNFDVDTFTGIADSISADDVVIMVILFIIIVSIILWRYLGWQSV
jgi:hypothetical protein